MQQETQFDLIVVGSGTAGAFSAIARPGGLKMAVVERGTAGGGRRSRSDRDERGGLSGGAPLRGIEREVFDRLIWGGHAAYHFAVPMSSNKEVKIDRLPL